MAPIRIATPTLAAASVIDSPIIGNKMLNTLPRTMQVPYWHTHFAVSDFPNPAINARMAIAKAPKANNIPNTKLGMVITAVKYKIPITIPNIIAIATMIGQPQFVLHIVLSPFIDFFGIVYSISYAGILILVSDKSHKKNLPCGRLISYSSTVVSKASKVTFASIGHICINVFPSLTSISLPCSSLYTVCALLESFSQVILIALPLVI